MLLKTYAQIASGGFQNAFFEAFDLHVFAFDIADWMTALAISLFAIATAIYYLGTKRKKTPNKFSDAVSKNTAGLCEPAALKGLREEQNPDVDLSSQTASRLSYSEFLKTVEEMKQPELILTDDGPSHPVKIDWLLQTQMTMLPNSAMRVAKLARDLRTSSRSIANAIGSDPVLTARVLRAVNSPLYYLERQVSSLPAAINIIGNSAIYNLVLSYAASDAFHIKGHRAPAERALWKHSVMVGCVARELMIEMRRPGSEEAFLCGLLHDIGKLFLLRHDGQGYEQLKDANDEQELLDHERKRYGYTHSEIGALVVRKWNLAHEISHAIYDHHELVKVSESILLAHVLNVADELANAAGIGMRLESLPNRSSPESVSALGLSDEQLNSAWERAETSMSEMMALLTQAI